MWFDCLPAEKRFSIHDESDNLLYGCYLAFRVQRFPRFIELCGTSDALVALAAAHAEDYKSLCVLSLRHSWNEVLARI